MSKVNLISQLYSKRQTQIIQKLYIEDLSSHKSIYQSISAKLFESEQFINAKALDMLSLIFMQNSFRASQEEIFSVAIFVYKSLFYEHPLPYLSDGNTLEFSIKTLTSLSFFRHAMEKQTERHGAPTPNYYREASKIIFKRNGYEDIATNHLRWENFLCEALPY